MAIIVAAFKNSDQVFAEGFKVDGEKYTVINANENSLWGKKASLRNSLLKVFILPQANLTMTPQGKEGLVIRKTQQALLIAHHPNTVTTQSCVSTVETLGDYLISVGY